MKDNMEPMFADTVRQRDNTIDIRGIFLRIREYWLFILVCLVLSMLCGYFYLRYSTPKYIADAKVLIKTGQKDAANGALLEELGVHGSNTNAQN
ncbi:MAG: Wzz/FepE/Etk N-terminal domain-containing protein, partial [Flavipsychrobacter sp.]